MKRLSIPFLMLAASLASAPVAAKSDAASAGPSSGSPRSADITELVRIRGCYTALSPDLPAFSAPIAGSDEVYTLFGKASDDGFSVDRCPSAPGEGVVVRGCVLVGSHSGSPDAEAANTRERREALAAFTADIDKKLAKLREQGSAIPAACQGPQPRRRGRGRVLDGGRCGGQCGGESKALQEAAGTPR